MDLTPPRKKKKQEKSGFHLIEGPLGPELYCGDRPASEYRPRPGAELFVIQNGVVRESTDEERRHYEQLSARGIFWSMWASVQLGAIGRAALDHATRGIPIFPCKQDKRPYVKGGFNAATTNPKVIADWWRKYPDALIGMPTGGASGIAVLDLDVKDDKNGLNAIPDWESRSNVIVRTRSGGIHLYFKNDDRVRSQTSKIAPGVDTRGNGGYVIVPPSNGYEFIKGDLSDRSALQPWPPDLFPKEQRNEAPPPHDDERETIGDYEREKITSALNAISPDIDYNDWFRIGCAVRHALGAEGFKVFDAWSKPSKKYNRNELLKQWEAWATIDRISIATLYHYADKTQTAWRDEFNAKHGYELVCAADVKPKAKNWLWPGHLLRGSLGLITGIKGQGKSQLQCHLIACVTTGGVWPDGSKGCAPVNVIMLTAEDTLDQEVVPRLMAAKADLTHVHILKKIRRDKRNRMFLLSEDLELLAKIIVRVGNVGVVTLDPITAYMGKVDSHKATDVRGTLGPLAEMAERTRVHFSAITHPAKAAASQRAIDSYIGSQAFIAAARIGHMCVEEIGEDGKATGRKLFTNVANNPHSLMPTLAYRIESVAVDQDPETNAAITSPYIVWDKEPVNMTADQALMAAAKAGRPGRADEAVDFLRMTLAGGPKSVKEIEELAKGHMLSMDQLRRAKAKLPIDVKKGGVKGGWIWTLNEPM